MPIEDENKITSVTISKDMQKKLEKTNKLYQKHFGNKASFGRCIFLSWYCSLGNCDFCYRSTQKHKIPNPSEARRRDESLYTEAFLAKVLNWKLEFLTGGYGILPFDELQDIIKIHTEIFEEKVWLNIGVLGKAQMNSVKDDVEGVVASVESLTPHVRKKAAPGKPLKPFERMLEWAKELNLKRSCTIILGLGEQFNEYHYVKEFIKKHDLNRITFYALRPVVGTPYKQGPSPEYVLKWITQTRLDFPTLEIAYGTAESRLAEIPYMLRAGANIITKLPATKLFATTGGQRVHEAFSEAGREFDGEFVNYPHPDWPKLLDKTSMDDALKEKTLKKIINYETNRMNKKFKQFKLVKDRVVCEPCNAGLD